MCFSFTLIYRQWSHRLPKRARTEMDRSWNPAATGITTAHWKLNENIVFDKMLVTKKAREEKNKSMDIKLEMVFVPYQTMII